METNLQEKIKILKNDVSTLQIFDNELQKMVELIAIPIDETIIKEQNEEVKNLKEELDSLKEVMSYLNKEVSDQGNILDSSEKNTSNADINVEEAVKNIEIVEKKIKKLRIKKAYILAGLFGTGVVGGAGFALGVIPGLIGLGVGLTVGLGALGIYVLKGKKLNYR